jgi:hypothetical protein
MCSEAISCSSDICNYILRVFKIDPVVGSKLQTELLLVLPGVCNTYEKMFWNRKGNIPTAITRRPIYFAY